MFAYSSLEAIAGRTLVYWCKAAPLRPSGDVVAGGARGTRFARKFSGAGCPGIGRDDVALVVHRLDGLAGVGSAGEQVAVSSMRLFVGLPIFGEPLARYVSDRTVPSLLFFVVFSCTCCRCSGLRSGWRCTHAREPHTRLLPNRALSLRAGRHGPGVDRGAGAAGRAGANGGERRTDRGRVVSSPLALGLRFQHAGLWIALFGGTALGAVVPWLGRRRPAQSFQATIDQSRCRACTQCVQDCPFDAITMVARTDGKNRPGQAEVDPARCVGCGVCGGSCDSEGLTLPWFDTRGQEARLQREIVGARERGGVAWVALVSSDIDGGYGYGARGGWARTLAGFEVHFVPTTAGCARSRRAVARDGHNGRTRGAGCAGGSGRGTAAGWAKGSRRNVTRFRQERAGGGAWCVVD